jgi:hypothetical protein
MIKHAKAAWKITCAGWGNCDAGISCHIQGTETQPADNWRQLGVWPDGRSNLTLKQKPYHSEHNWTVSGQNAGTRDLPGHPYDGNVFHKYYKHGLVPMK